MNFDLIKQWIFVIIRYVGPFAAGWLATTFGITSADASGWIATTLTILMAAWALVNKYRYETKVNTALDLPQYASKDKLKDIISNGLGTAGSVAK